MRQRWAARQRPMGLLAVLWVLAGLSLGLVRPVLTPAADPLPSPPLRVCLISGADEYETDRTLAAFQTYLEGHFPVECVLLKARGTTDLPGLEALDHCDVVLLYTRRLTLPPDQLERLKRYLTSGRPLVALRTASHALQNWLAFDHEVLGGSYNNHYRNDLSQRTAETPVGKGHPVLRNVGTIASRGSLYRTGPVADDCTVLLTSTSPEATEPAAWVRPFQGGRVFYTSLGATGDFENGSFLRLITNALFWTAGRDVPETIEVPVSEPRADVAENLVIPVRQQVETTPGANQWQEKTATVAVPASRVAVVICDMWDLHWCRGATERADAIAARMNPVLESLRNSGVLIVHAPSETMDFYRDTPARLRAQRAPMAPPPPRLTPARAEPPLPIDDSDGGCDTDDEFYLAWTRQNPRIKIDPADAVSDNGDEIYNLLQQRGITHILMMGVHTNMCVLNRGFAIRAMTARGMHCILVRDLTDAMYDPRDRPNVSHEAGTNLVIEHIEKYGCPSTLSAEIGRQQP